MVKTVADLKVGDTVWYSDINQKGLREERVSKIGNKLITTLHVVFRKDTLQSNDAYGHRRLIVDKQEYLMKKEGDRLWREVRDVATSMSSRRDSITFETLMQVAKLLGIE